jgi:hypothetical protein
MFLGSPFYIYYYLAQKTPLAIMSDASSSSALWFPSGQQQDTPQQRYPPQQDHPLLPLGGAGSLHSPPHTPPINDKSPPATTSGTMTSKVPRNKAIICKRFLEQTCPNLKDECPYLHSDLDERRPIPRTTCQHFPRSSGCLRGACPFFHGSQKQLDHLTLSNGGVHGTYCIRDMNLPMMDPLMPPLTNGTRDLQPPQPSQQPPGTPSPPLSRRGSDGGAGTAGAGNSNTSLLSSSAMPPMVSTSLNNSASSFLTTPSTLVVEQRGGGGTSIGQPSSPMLGLSMMSYGGVSNASITQSSAAHQQQSVGPFESQQPAYLFFPQQPQPQGFTYPLFHHQQATHHRSGSLSSLSGGSMSKQMSTEGSSQHPPSMNTSSNFVRMQPWANLTPPSMFQQHPIGAQPYPVVPSTAMGVSSAHFGDQIAWPPHPQTMMMPSAAQSTPLQPSPSYLVQPPARVLGQSDIYRPQHPLGATAVLPQLRGDSFYFSSPCEGGPLYAQQQQQQAGGYQVPPGQQLLSSTLGQHQPPALVYQQIYTQFPEAQRQQELFPHQQQQMMLPTGGNYDVYPGGNVLQRTSTGENNPHNIMCHQGAGTLRSQPPFM